MKDMLEGLDGLWARLELLHTGVTLSKQGSRGHKDLASASTDAQVSRLVHGGVVFPRKESSWQLMQTCCAYVKTLSTVMCHYGKRLQCCQTHLNDSTQLLQVNTRDHAGL